MTLNPLATASRLMKRHARWGLVLPLLLATACGPRFENAHQPTPSNLVVDGQTIPEVNRISIPMPTKVASPTPTRAQASSLWHSGSTSFFGDQRASAIGDILTVAIDINDQAQLRNSSERSRSGAQAVRDPLFFGYGQQIENILIGIDGDDLPTGGSIVDLGSSSESSGEGSIRRNESISLRVAVLIIDELPNENFVIAGRQEVMVNNELRELRVAGIIRSADIDAQNTVSYDKIAEARIAYGGRGQISTVQQPRYGENLLDVILPY